MFVAVCNTDHVQPIHVKLRRVWLAITLALVWFTVVGLIIFFSQTRDSKVNEVKPWFRHRHKRLCIPRRTLWRYTNVVLLLL